MAARMPVQCVVSSVIALVGLGTCVQAQYLYAGPGTVVQRQVRGPFVYNFYGYPYLAPGTYLSAPVIVPPVPNPYLRGPVLMTPRPYGYGYVPDLYPPRASVRQQPYRGYLPSPNRSRSADAGTPARPAPQVGERSPRAGPRPSGTVAQQRAAEPKPDAPSAGRPPRTAPTPERVRQPSAVDANTPASPNPN
jgi:hypothetical protein